MLGLQATLIYSPSPFTPNAMDQRNQRFGWYMLESKMLFKELTMSSDETNGTSTFHEGNTGVIIHPAVLHVSQGVNPTIYNPQVSGNEKSPQI